MKDTRKIAVELRMAYWTEIMRERAASGLSIIEYCGREGIHPNRYYYWQRKLRSAAAESMAEAAKPANMPVPLGWTQVEESSPAKAEKSEVVIEIGRGRIVATRETDPELLAKAIKALVEIC